MGLIIGVNITSILKSTEDNEKEFDKEQIEKAACVFADSEVRDEVGFIGCGGSPCTVRVPILVSSGLLGNEYAGEKYNSKSVTITYKNDGEKVCKYNE